MGNELTPYQEGDLTWYLVTPPGLDIQFPLVRTPDNRVHWPFHYICEHVLGIDSTRQLQKVRASGRLARLLTDFKAKTRSGMRKTVFLAGEGLAPFLHTIQPERVKDEVKRQKIDDFQAWSFRVFNDILWGKLQPVAPGQVTIGGAGKEDGGRLTMQDIAGAMQFIEGRVNTIESAVFAQPYVEDSAMSDEDEEGILNIPFYAPRGGHYIIRLRQLPWKAPEVIEIRPAEEE